MGVKTRVGEGRAAMTKDDHIEQERQEEWLYCLTCRSEMLTGEVSAVGLKDAISRALATEEGLGFARRNGITPGILPDAPGKDAGYLLLTFFDCTILVLRKEQALKGKKWEERHAG
jgi:hypothetical protein